ncbi:MAG: DUF4340 domain-containing protein [bacterium]|nr:DUF4340 domain-containing protein [bacterium]
MDETRKTLIFVGVAVVLALAAYIFSPSRITPDAFMDQGEAFYPEFTDPNTATTLEVIDYDEASGTARPFKVTFGSGGWTIPSHNNYPADAKDRLAQTAAGVIDIKKDDFRTSSAADHEHCGVVDPLDATAPGLSGRGSRITLKGADDQVLADYIVGYEIPDREGMRFVRLPGQNRVYAARMDIEISTNFADWIETNLLEVSGEKIDRVMLKDYSIDERTRSVVQGSNIELLRGEDNIWRMKGIGAVDKLDSTVVETLVSTLSDLSIVGVRPKPEGLSAELSDPRNDNISQEGRLSLQSKGYYFTRDGQLLSNEGEMNVRTTDGVIYILRFGEVLYGSGLNVTAGRSESGGGGDDGQGQANRYLFVAAGYENGYFKKPAEPRSREYLEKADSLWTDADRENKARQDAVDEWQRNVENGRQLAADLNNRFAGWYYVISEDSFGNIHLDREALTADQEG